MHGDSARLCVADCVVSGCLLEVVHASLYCHAVPRFRSTFLFFFFFYFFDVPGVVLSHVSKLDVSKLMNWIVCSRPSVLPEPLSFSASVAPWGHSYVPV